MSENTKVVESTEYDNFLGKSEVKKESNIFDVLGIEDTSETNEPQKHWKGMPEFINENNPPYMKIYINFRNKQDYEEFAKLIDQNLSERTKSIWYPKLDREENSLLRWIEE